MPTSPTSRSLALLRAEGYHAEVVERWIAGARIRKDLFGIIDIIAILKSEFIEIGKGENTTLAVQTTTASNLAARRIKCIASPMLPEWLHAGHDFHLHGWKKSAAQRRARWVCTIERFYFDERGVVRSVCMERGK